MECKKIKEIYKIRCESSINHDIDVYTNSQPNTNEQTTKNCLQIINLYKDCCVIKLENSSSDKNSKPN